MQLRSLSPCKKTRWSSCRKQRSRSSAKKACFAFPACPDGFFGIDCHQVCKCKNAAGCDHVLGSCHCLPGWLGESCEQRTYTPAPNLHIPKPLNLLWEREHALILQISNLPSQRYQKREQFLDTV